MVESVANNLFLFGQLVSPEGATIECSKLTLEVVHKIVHKLLANKPLETIAVGPVS